MNALAAIRRRHKRWNPRLAAFLAAAWLGMLWQPCAMAMDMEAHAGHEQQHSCPHCPPPQHTDCEDAADACVYVDRYDADRRAAKHKAGAGVEDVQFVALPSCVISRLPLPSSGFAGFAVHETAPPIRPPLNILFCSYLK